MANRAPTFTSKSNWAISENSTQAATLSAKDPDKGDTLTYSIIGGADAGKFVIEPSTGVLTFVFAPDFEVKSDADGNNVYDVIVKVTDAGNLSSSQTLAITVKDVVEAGPNNPPAISSNGGQDSAAVNVAENSKTVTTVVASDQDANTTLAYSIVGGADSSKFTINSTTGALSFAAVPDFEAPADTDLNNVYDVVVQASDGTLADTQALAVSITDITEATSPAKAGPVISSNGGADTASTSVDENSTAVTTVTATSANKNAKLAYSISGGADIALFNINTTTGELSFVAVTDYEKPLDSGKNNVYEVIVKVTDSAGFSDTQALAVSVKDLNETIPNTAPVITSDGGGATAAVSVNENSTAATQVTVSDTAGDTVGYLLTGADAALFDISATGALTFMVAPDFEAPTDAGKNNVYDVTVQVTDGGGLTDTQALALTVNDVVETAPNIAPVITSDGGGATAAVSVNENSTAATQVTVSDTAGDTVGYLLTGADAALFDISATGALTFMVAPDFEAPTDAGKNNVYDVTVQVTDGGGLTDTQALALTVNDVVETAPNIAPVITSDGGGATAAVSVNENSTAATQVTVSDTAGDTVAYLLTGADAALFDISATGALTFMVTPDFEAPTDTGKNNVYDVTVQAIDGGGLTDTQALALTVKDVVETAPNAAPVGKADSYIAAYNQPLNVAASIGVLANDTDADHDTLTALKVSGPAHGSLTLNADGSFTYTPIAGYVGADSFTYLPNDGKTDGAVVTASLTVAVPGSTGPLSVLTTGPDVITGGAENSEIRGTSQTLNSSDQIDGGGGSDTLALYGAGSFDLRIQLLTGIEQVNLINDAGGATVYLSHVAGLSLAGSSNLDSVYSDSPLESGSSLTLNAGDDFLQVRYNGLSADSSVSGGAGNDSLFFYYGDWYSTTVAGQVDAGEGNDYVYLYSTSLSGQINAGSGDDSVNIGSLLPGGTIDGGDGNDGVSYSGTVDLIGADPAIKNFESLNITGGQSTISQAFLDSHTLTGSGTLVTAESTLNLSGKTWGSLYFASTNNTGTTFTVTDDATALRVLGGTGNDILDASSVALTETQRSVIFAQGSIETIKDASGTYSAVAGSSINLTTGNDVITGDAQDSEIRATSQTLNPGDQIDGGGGSDTLALYGAGSFDLRIQLLTGIEQVNLINDAGGATVYLSHVAGLSLAGSSNLDSVYSDSPLESGSSLTLNAGDDFLQVRYNGLSADSSVSGGAGNDSLFFYYGDWYSTTVAGQVDAGEGNDYVYLYSTSLSGQINAGSGDDSVNIGSLLPGGTIDGGDGNDGVSYSGTVDLIGADPAIKNFESLNITGGQSTISQAFLDSHTLTGSGTLVTAESTLNLSGKTWGSLYFASTNNTGTTFTVTDDATALRVLGGTGNDILDASSVALTETQLIIIFDQGSVETIQDANGTHTAADFRNTAQLTQSVELVGVGQMLL